MSTIVTRAGKGASLSWTEADENFTNLNNDKIQEDEANTFTALQTVNAGLKLGTGGVRGEVTMVRTAETTWSVTDEKGVAIDTTVT